MKVIGCSYRIEVIDQARMIDHLIGNVLQHGDVLVEDSSVVKNEAWNVTLRIDGVEVNVRCGFVTVQVNLLDLEVQSSCQASDERSGATGRRSIVKLGHTDIQSRRF